MAKDKRAASEPPKTPDAGAARAAERRPGTVPAPQFVGETIIFHCPRGHRLVVASRHAGKQGRCDKKGCGAPVIVPLPPRSPASQPAEAAAEVEMLEAVVPAAPPAPAVPSPPIAAAEAVDLEPLPAEPVATEPVVLVGGPPTDEPTPTAPGGWDFIGGDTAAPPPVEAEAAADPSTLSAGQWAEDQAEAEAFDNPTARLVARLWVERDNGGVVELHLVGGSVILPEWYDARWSRGTHGLFASQAPDGTVTLTAVAWDAIQKVVVRQVQYIPDGMFE